MTPFRDMIDNAVNFSGGVYVGLATLTVLGLAIAEYVSGTPMVVATPDGRAVTYIVHQAPQWFVGTVGVYVVILGLFWIGKPIKTMVDASKTLTEAKAEAVKNAPPDKPAGG